MTINFIILLLSLCMSMVLGYPVCVYVYTARTFMRSTVSQHTRATLYRWRHCDRRLGPSELNSLSATSLARPFATRLRINNCYFFALDRRQQHAGRKCPIEYDSSR